MKAGANCNASTLRIVGMSNLRKFVALEKCFFRFVAGGRVNWRKSGEAQRKTIRKVKTSTTCFQVSTSENVKTQVPREMCRFKEEPTCHTTPQTKRQNFPAFETSKPKEKH